jgi:hypothetical protein
MPVDWEYRAGFGVLWVLAAAVAVALGKGNGRSGYQAGVLLLLVLFGLGGGALLGKMPGFRLFALPARMFLIAALPLSFLVGRATDMLSAGLSGEERERCRRVARGTVGLSCVVMILEVALTARAGLRFHPYWVALPALCAAAFWLLRRTPGASGLAMGRPAWTLAWSALLLADLWVMARPHLGVRAEADLMGTSAGVRYLVEHKGEHGRVLDRHLPEPRAMESPLGTAVPLMLRLETLRGYNALDIHRYREYLQFISDRDGTLPPIRQVRNFPIRNKALLDLLGTRYVLQPSDPALLTTGDRVGDDPGWRKVLDDAAPSAFVLFHGTETLPAYTLYENRDALPRAFVVPDAALLPTRAEVLKTLRSNDFRRTVLLEDPAALTTGTPAGQFRAATVAAARPNRVTLRVDGGPHGYLVLADVWFPGWTATVDGQPAKVHRANYLFRAIALPAGAREVVFAFAPASLARGKAVSAAAVGLVAVVCLSSLLSRRRAREKQRSRGAGAVLAPYRGPTRQDRSPDGKDLGTSAMPHARKSQA